MKKILIFTSWWPTKTNCFIEYSNGISRLLESKEYETEFFITTNFHESKYGSIYQSFKQAEQWALYNNFDFILNIDADIVLSLENFEKMVKLDRGVLLTGRGHGTGLSVLNIDSPTNGQIGWGCCLIKTEVLKKVPFVYSGDYLPPDRMWFKKLNINCINVWCCFDIVPICLEKSSLYPIKAFQPKTI